MNNQTKALINHLLKTYKKDVLETLFGISSATWRQHKAYIDTNGRSGTILSSKHYKNIKNKYLEFLDDRLKELRDIDIDNW